eukprot:6010627-Prymnesium_polylepis.1
MRKVQPRASHVHGLPPPWRRKSANLCACAAPDPATPRAPARLRALHVPQLALPPRPQNARAAGGGGQQSTVVRARACDQNSGAASSLARPARLVAE